MPPAAEYVELDEDGEEVEYAEFTVEDLLQQVVDLKAQLAGLVEEASDDLSGDNGL